LQEVYKNYFYTVRVTEGNRIKLDGYGLL